MTDKSKSRSIWIVTDYGGEYEDHWETVVRAFSTEEEAMECRGKRGLMEEGE